VGGVISDVAFTFHGRERAPIPAMPTQTTVTGEVAILTTRKSGIFPMLLRELPTERCTSCFRGKKLNPSCGGKVRTRELEV
jgi:hypothetical protein